MEMIIMSLIVVVLSGIIALFAGIQINLANFRKKIQVNERVALNVKGEFVTVLVLQVHEKSLLVKKFGSGSIRPFLCAKKNVYPL